MVKISLIDIIEQEILNLSEELFDTLLKDRTTQRNICWATECYISYGKSYYPQEPILKDLITGFNTNIIHPRAAKISEDKARRTKDKAEVFTPSWICNEQNNLVDEAWFGRKDVFNISINNTWITNKALIKFPDNKTWKNYIDSKRLEISCGEAPYLVSRYDTVTGKEIPLEERIGLLDRKLRIVNENTHNEEEWFFWTKRAYESIYGFEYQGDSLLLARENLFYTFIENMEYKFSHKPNEKQLKVIAKIISWNIWQMDGITMTVPFSERSREKKQLSMFENIIENDYLDKEPIPCKIYDWRANKSIEFKNIIKGGKDI